MFIHYRTQGFIFKKEDRGEADQLFTIYSKDFGKLEILGKSIRKISSKLRSGAELFNLSEIEFIQGKTYKILTDAVLVENFQNLKKNLNRLAIAYKISEVLDNLIKGQEPDQKIWQLLNKTFEQLNALEIRNCPPASEFARRRSRAGKLEILYYYFLWNLLSILGYQPELYNCSLCQKELIPERLYFNPKEGGIICQSCFKKVKSGRGVKPEVIKILRIILKKDWKLISKLRIEKPYLKSLKVISKESSSTIDNNS